MITSPEYPNNYPPNANFETILTVGLSKVILIEFEDFDVEEDSECSYDKLVVQEQAGVRSANQFNQLINILTDWSTS